MTVNWPFEQLVASWMVYAEHSKLLHLIDEQMLSKSHEISTSTLQYDVDNVGHEWLFGSTSRVCEAGNFLQTHFQFAQIHYIYRHNFALSFLVSLASLYLLTYVQVLLWATKQKVMIKHICAAMSQFFLNLCITYYLTCISWPTKKRKFHFS